MIFMGGTCTLSGMISNLQPHTALESNEWQWWVIIKWEEWMAKICKPFTMAKIRYFDVTEIEAA